MRDAGHRREKSNICFGGSRVDSRHEEHLKRFPDNRHLNSGVGLPPGVPPEFPPILDSKQKKSES